jgi:leucyl-tRNA synthetase
MLAALMEFCNFLSKVQDNKGVSVQLWEEAIKVLLLLLAPTAPHFTEELWARTGHSYSIHNQTWPDWNEQLASEEEVTLAIQINGKLRDTIVVSASATEKEVKELILVRERVKLYTAGKEISKTIYVPKRVLNIIAK